MVAIGLTLIVVAWIIPGFQWVPILLGAMLVAWASLFFLSVPHT